MSTVGRELSNKYSRRARAGVAVVGGITIVALIAPGCSDRFGTGACEETRTCAPQGQGGTQAGAAGDEAGEPVDSQGGANGGSSSEPHGGTSSEPSGGDPGVTNESGAAGVGGEVGSALTITEPSLPSGKTYVPYSTTIGATGATSFAWTIAGGALPAGLTLTETNSADVKIEGTPSEAGLFPLTLSVTDGTSTAEVEVTLAITHAVLFLSDRDAPGVNELYLSEVGGTTAPAPVRLNASLPNGGGVQSYAWSPDGTKVLYIVKQSPGGAPELWVANVAVPGTAKRVSTAGTTVSLMTWLGAGNIAAYMTSVGDAYLVDLSGATPGASKLGVAATTTPLGLMPSPNGTSVTVASFAPGGGMGPPFATLSQVSWAGGAVQSVTLQAADVPNTIQYSYDGRFGIAVSPTSNQWWNLSLASPTATSFGIFSAVSWNPRNETVLYMPFDAPHAVFLGSFENSVLSSTKVVQDGCSQPSSAIWSPDGRNAYFTCVDELRAMSDISNAAIDTDFSLLPSGFSSNAPNPNFVVSAVGWSPDGHWIAFRTDRDVDDTFDLNVVRWATPGTLYRPHANPSGLGVVTAAFAPNSESIAFVGTVAPQTSAALYLARLPSSGAPPLAALVSAPSNSVVQQDISWLPGSRTIAYRAIISGKSQLFAASLEAEGTASAVPISAAGGSDVSSYQLAPSR